MKGDDYWQGRHFWTHFWCGLILGGVLSARICWRLFENGWLSLAAGAALALTIALLLANFGERLWRWILEHWS